MGNHHSGQQNENLHYEHYEKRGGFVARKRHKLEELTRRRQSMPLERFVMDTNEDSSNNRHSNFTSFAYGEKEENVKRPLTPRIQINGQDSGQPSTPSDHQSPVNQRHTFSLSVDFADNQMRSPLVTNGVPEENGSAETSPPKRRFVRNPKSAATRRMEFLSFSNNFVVRSLDESAQDFEIDMKPLSHRARSLSPLKQLRTYSMDRRYPSDENVLTPEHCQMIRESWKLATELIELNNCRPFGFLVLKRVLDKMPKLKVVFKLDSFGSIMDVPLEHSFVRHTGLFQSIIDLAVRNVEELESEIAPVLFAYGRRHYEHDLHNMFSEETVRLFCGQVVCTLLDLLGNKMSTALLEAWIEFMRYLGRALLNGFEYEQLNRNKFKISTKDHAFFLG
ncbi:GLOBIN domain-containing protein [Aphelenchoides bicaudatus]|nr:GLOBIN domain-containing protein [Aphelenchoides bicaudatus]